MIRVTRRPPTTREVTFDEYLKLPPSEGRSEVINGIIVMSPGASGDHQWIIGNIHANLFPFIRARGLGVLVLAPADVLVRKEPKLQIRQPDLAYFSTARTGLRGRADLKGVQVFESVPDLAIEVISPSDRKQAWESRLADYAALGISEVWRVEPRKETVEVLRIESGHYVRAGLYASGEIVQSKALPGVDLKVDAVFE